MLTNRNYDTGEPDASKGRTSGSVGGERKRADEEPRLSPTLLRLFDMNDADDTAERSRSQIVSGPGGYAPDMGNALAAHAASGNAAGEAEMAQPELLETVAEDAELSGFGTSDGRGVSRSRKGIGVAETDAAGEERDPVEAE